MNQTIEAEVKEKLLSTSFFGPLKELDSMGLNISEYTTYSFIATDACCEPLFAAQLNDAAIDQPCTSAAMCNGHASTSSDPAPPPFDETHIVGKQRCCHLCGRNYLNRKHSNLYKDTNTCCICKETFENDALLKIHNEKYIKSGVCCKKNCSMAFSGNPIEDEKHFNRHK